MPDRPAEQAGEEGADRRGRGQDADGDRSAADDDRADRGEQHVRTPEAHREQVEQEARPDVRCAAQERESLAQRAQARPLASRCSGGQPREGSRTPRNPAVKSDGVDGVGPGEADRGDEDAGERRPEGELQPERDAVQRARGRDQVGGQEARRDRRAGRIEIVAATALRVVST